MSPKTILQYTFTSTQWLVSHVPWQVTFCLFAHFAWSADDPPRARLETHKDLITKAQNLTIQRDRLQTSQVLIRGIQKESPKEAAKDQTLPYKELVKALNQLSSVFYTEKAQTAFVTGESHLMNRRYREALSNFQEALKQEDGNVAVLQALARTHLILDECSKADQFISSAEQVNPYSPETELLRLQELQCSKSFQVLTSKLAEFELAAFPLARASIVQMKLQLLVKTREIKKAKVLLQEWEAELPSYPQVRYWHWKLSEIENSSEVESSVSTHGRVYANEYIQMCQNLSPRKRKSYILDVDLCKGKDEIENYLEELGDRQASSPGGVAEKPKNDKKPRSP